MSSIIGELVTIIIMAFALGMDAFSISLGMGMYRLRFKQMLNIGLIVGIFHILMPLLGMIAGRFLSEKFDAVASYIGGGLLLILGVQMIWSSFRKESESLITPVGFGIAAICLKC